MNIVLTNASTLCADADLAIAAGAVNAQLGTAASWYDRQPALCSFVAASDLSSLPADPDVLIVVLDDADQAGALGYHAETPDGHPYARVFARDSIAGLGGVDPQSLTGAQPQASTLGFVAPVVSHEALEAFGDVHANDWADDGNGVEFAYELCDPVESLSYTEDVDGVPVTVSDFVTPAWFDPAAPIGAQFDVLSALTSPLTIAPGGYALVMQEGSVGQEFGSQLPAWRKAQHEAAYGDAALGADTVHVASRTGRIVAKHMHGVKAAPPAPTAADGEAVEDLAQVVENAGGNASVALGGRGAEARPGLPGEPWPGHTVVVDGASHRIVNAEGDTVDESGELTDAEQPVADASERVVG